MDSPPAPSGKLSRERTGGPAGPGEPDKAEGGTAGKGGPRGAPTGEERALKHLPAHDSYFILFPRNTFFSFLRYVKSGKPAFPFLAFPFLSLFTLSAGFSQVPSRPAAGLVIWQSSLTGAVVVFAFQLCHAFAAERAV